MAYVSNSNGYEVGNWVNTKQKIESCSGYFEPGTKVKITGISERGYDLVDEYGNRMIECGWECIRK